MPYYSVTLYFLEKSIQKNFCHLFKLLYKFYNKIDFYFVNLNLLYLVMDISQEIMLCGCREKQIP